MPEVGEWEVMQGGDNGLPIPLPQVKQFQRAIQLRATHEASQVISSDCTAILLPSLH